MSLIRKSKYREFILAFCDMLIVTFSYFFSLFIRLDFNGDWIDRYIYTLVTLLPLFILVNALFYVLFKIHRSLWSYMGIDEALRVAYFSMFSNLFLLIINPYILTAGFPKSIFIVATLLSASVMLGLRISYRYFRRFEQLSKRKNNALIIGAGDAGSLLCREIIVNKKYDVKIVGFIDDSKYKQGKILNGYTVLGMLDDIEKIKNKYHVKTVFIAIPSATKTEMTRIVKLCRKADLEVKIMGIEVLGSNNQVKLRDVSIEDLLGRGEIKLDEGHISSYLENKVVMVTGAGGLIGSELCRQIVGFKPKKLVMVDMYENNLYDLQMEFEMSKRKETLSNEIELVSIISSVRDKEAISKVIKSHSPNIVYHAAAHKHVPLMETVPQEAVKNNVFGTRNVLICCIENKVEKFVLISTDKAVHPTNVMGATKRMAELLVQAYRNNGVTSVAAVRFGNVLGSNGSVIPLFKRQLEKGGPLTVTHPDIIRYFMTIPEATQLVLQAGAYSSNGEIFVLDMGEPVKIVD